MSDSKMKLFEVHETLRVISFIEAETEEQAKDIVEGRFATEFDELTDSSITLVKPVK